MVQGLLFSWLANQSVSRGRVREEEHIAYHEVTTKEKGKRPSRLSRTDERPIRGEAPEALQNAFAPSKLRLGAAMELSIAGLAKPLPLWN